ncbi:MtaA/CmuA family methyltransferase [Heliobacillus mobilis]|uniref:MtaA/CmuA family methyltransferase n=1 Tax=Heliobacterium mobile TaxID=28064 RepID=A0A6I3SHQ7_HELMO|nr:MtaA/CmuA family methyltransferase [Heliobacterium mobile]MTV48237.1 MtaA/CmuA family methyltransferase [Heliobacterium mobile]
MSAFSPKERLLRVLDKEKIDRAPVVCPGGMMNAAIVEVMNRTGHTLPEAHHDDTLMAELAFDVADYTGFENIGIPFCMTVEAEVLGSGIDVGTLACEPKIRQEAYPSVSQVEFKEPQALLRSGRINTVVQAAYRLARKHPDYPIIGNLTGPISTAASIVDPMSFLKELRKDKENAHRVIDYVSNVLIAYAQLMVDAGVKVISIGDPTATGEILGPKMFEEYAVPYLNKVIDGIHELDAAVIVHICGKMQSVRHMIPLIKGDAISTDAMVNLKRLKEDYPQLTTMGNLSTYLLEGGNYEDVSRHTRRLVGDGIDIIAPACGLSTSTTIQALQAMTQTVKEL